ncbi:hypothetical protein ACQR5W_11560 [Xanthomonas sacchari]
MAVAWEARGLLGWWYDFPNKKAPDGAGAGMGWFYALALKMVLSPIILFGYWLVAIKFPNSIKRFIPEGKIKEALYRERY